MENFLTEVAKQVPSLGVLCFIVFIFLRHLDKKEETLKEMHSEHLDAREQSREVMKENAAAFKDNREAIVELRSAIKDKLCQS